MTSPPQRTTIDDLLERFPALLLDAYGVLVDKTGPLPGATALIARLNQEGRPYAILSNSASRLPEAMAADFAAQGLPIPAERVVTSGTLIAAHFDQHGLGGARCRVLGPEDSCTLVRRAGGVVVGLDTDDEVDVIVIADQKGVEHLDTLDSVLSGLIRQTDAGRPPHLLLCNPDLIYPVAPGRFGFTAGTLATMLEAVLTERYGAAAPPLYRLGKPHPPIFEAGIGHVGTSDAVMIGDQLATDILGANLCGIASALVSSGLGGVTAPNTVEPTFILPDIMAKETATNFNCGKTVTG